MEVFCWHLRKRQFLEKIPPYTKRNHPHFLYFAATPGIEWNEISLHTLKPLDMETYVPKQGDALVYVNVIKVLFKYMTMNTYMMRLLYDHAITCKDPACKSNNCYIVKYLLRHQHTCPYYDCPTTGLCYYVPEWIRSLHRCKKMDCFICNQGGGIDLNRRKRRKLRE